MFCHQSSMPWISCVSKPDPCNWNGERTRPRGILEAFAMANHVVSGVRAALSTNDRTFLVQRRSLTQGSRFFESLIQGARQRTERVRILRLRLLRTGLAGGSRTACVL